MCSYLQSYSVLRSHVQSCAGICSYMQPMPSFTVVFVCVCVCVCVRVCVCVCLFLGVFVCGGLRGATVYFKALGI